MPTPQQNLTGEPNGILPTPDQEDEETGDATSSEQELSGQEGEPTPTSDDTDEESNDSDPEPEDTELKIDPVSSPRLYEALGMDREKFQPSIKENEEGEEELQSPEPKTERSRDPIDHSTDQILNAAADGKMPESPEVDIDPIDAPEDAGPLHFTRKWYGEEIQETTDPSNLVGLNDKSDQEVLQFVTEKRPDLVERGVIDPENPEQSLQNIEQYHRRRVQQRQRKNAHGTYFPELRSHMAATMENKEALDWSDEKLVNMYVKAHYQGQGDPDVADVVDDMIADGKQKFSAMEEASGNLQRAESPEELAKLTNKLEEQHENAEKEGYQPDMVISYTDPDTGADLMFASPERADQYQRKMRHRSLDHKDRGVVEEWLVGATARAGIDMADLLSEVGQYGARLADQAGADAEGAVNSIEEFQKNMQAVRQSGSVRQSDDLDDVEIYEEDDSWYMPSGGAISDPNWWASTVGEVVGLSAPGIGAAFSGGKLAKNLFKGMKFYGRAKRLKDIQKAGKKIKGVGEVTDGMVRKARAVELAAETGTVASLYEMPLESGEALKQLYKENDNPSAGDQAIAVGSGMVSGWIGTIGDMAFADFLRTSIGREFGEEIPDAAAKSVTRSVVGRLGTASKKFGGTIPVETGTEITQEVTKDVAEQWRSGEYDSFEEFWEENREKYGEVAAGSLGLTAFMGGLGGVSSTARSISEGKTEHEIKILEKMAEGNALEDVGGAHLYERRQGKGFDVRVDVSQLQDKETMENIRERFKEEGVEGVKIDVMDGTERVTSVQGFAELTANAPEIQRQAKRGDAVKVNGTFVSESRIDGLEEPGQEPQTSAKEGRRNQYETPLGTVYEGENAKEKANEAAQHEKYLNAVVEDGGDKYLITRVTTNEEGGDPQFQGKAVDGSGDTIAPDEINDDQVLAWRDQTDQIDSELTQKLDDVGEIDLVNPDDQTEKDIESLLKGAVDRGDIDQEQADNLRKKFREYKSVQNTLEQDGVPDSVRETARETRDNLMDELNEEFDGLISQRDSESNQNQEETGGDTDEAGEGGTPNSDTEEAGAAENPDPNADATPDAVGDGSENSNNNVSSEEADASNPAETANVSITEQIEQREQNQRGEDVEADPSAQTWSPADAGDAGGDVVYGPDGERGVVQSQAFGEFEVSLENGDQTTVEKSDGWTKVHPDDRQQTTDPTPPGETGTPPIKQQVANALGDFMESTGEAMQDRLSQFRQSIPDDWSVNEVTREDNAAGVVFEQNMDGEADAPVPYWEVQTPEGSFLLPQPQQGSFREFGDQSGDIDFAVEESQAVEDPSSIEPVPFNNRRVGDTSTNDTSTDNDTFEESDSDESDVEETDVDEADTDANESDGVEASVADGLSGRLDRAEQTQNAAADAGTIPQSAADQTWSAQNGDVLFGPDGERGVIESHAFGTFTVRTEDGQVEVTKEDGWTKLPPDHQQSVSKDTQYIPNDGDQVQTPMKTAESANPGSETEAITEDPVVYRSALRQADENDTPVRVIENNDGGDVFRKDEVKVLDESGREVDTITREELESQYGVTEGTQARTSDRDSQPTSEEVHQTSAEFSAFLDETDANLQNTEEVQEAFNEWRDGDTEADVSVREVYAEEVGGKTVMRETPAQATNDARTNAVTKYRVFNVDGMEFITPTTTSGGKNFSGTDALSKFGETDYNNRSLDPADGTPIEPYTTMIDGTGQRVAMGYGTSIEHLQDQQQGGDGPTSIGEVNNLEEARTLDLKNEHERQQQAAESAKEDLAAIESENPSKSEAKNTEAYQQAQARLDEALRNQKALEEQIESNGFDDAYEVLEGTPENTTRREAGAEQRFSKDVDVKARVRRELGGEGKMGTPLEVVRKVASELRALWPKMPKIQTVRSPVDLPMHIKKEAGSDLPLVEGVYDEVSGRVYLVSDNLNTAQEAVKIALHEVAGHHGLRNVVSEEQFTPVMKEAFRALEGQVLEADGTLRKAEANERENTILRKVSRTHGLDLSTDEGKANAAEEALAQIAESAPETTVLEDIWNKVYRMVRRAIRPVANALGFDEMTMSNGEIRSLVANARGSLSPKGSTYTSGSTSNVEHPWWEMGFKMSGPTYYSRMDDTILNPDDKVNQKFRNGNPVSPETMKSLLESVQNGRFKKAELDAIGIMDWLDRQTEDVTLEDVQQYIEEHQITLEEEVRRSKEAEALEKAETRLESTNQEVEKWTQALEEAQLAMDTESFEIVSDLIDTLEEQFDTDQAEAVAASFQQVTDQAIEQDDVSLLDMELRRELKNMGVGDEVLEAVHDMASLVTDLLNAQKSLESAQQRNREAREQHNSAQAAYQEAVENDSWRGVKYANYSLPGGTNPKNIVLRLPDTVATRRVRKSLQEVQNRIDELESRRANNNLPIDELDEIQEELVDLRNQKRDLNQILESDSYNSTHFPDDRNILAHMRFNEREVNGFKTLMVEEIQSDWIQDGKKEGFRQENRQEAQQRIEEIKTELETLEAERDAIVSVDGDANVQYPSDEASQLLEENHNRQEELHNEWDRLAEIVHGDPDSVPDLPDVLKDNWYSLAAKRVMLHAAKNGYDTVAWTTGDQQADRYHLGDRYQRIVYEDGSLIATRHNGSERVIPLRGPDSNRTQRELSDIVGETLAQELISEYERTGEPAVRDTREGLDNVDRREGMRSFYDEKLLNVFSDFTSKYGGQAAPASSEEFAVGPDNENSVHAATVPEKMKNQLPESGVPLFSLSKSQITSENFKEWFGDWQNNPENASQVVDQQTGEPKIVYHGTEGDFNTFQTTNVDDVLSRAVGSHFAEDKAVANFFATRKEEDPTADGFGRRIRSGSNLMPVYLDIKNPLVIEDTFMGNDDATVAFHIKKDVFSRRKDLFEKWASDMGWNDQQIDQAYQNLDETLREYAQGITGKMLRAQVVSDFLRNSEYDGIRYENDHHNETENADNPTAWIAFNREQVKSATGNNGSFSDSEGNINFSKDKDGSVDASSEDAVSYDDEGPGAESAVNPESIVGEIRNMLTQMKTPGNEAHERVKDFLIERGHQNMVDPNGRIVIESFSDVRTMSELVGEYLYYEWRDGIRGDFMNASTEQIDKAYAELEEIARNMDQVDEETSAEEARRLAFAKLIGDHLLRDRDISGLTPELTQLFENFAQEYNLEQNFYHVQDMFKALDSQGALDRFDSKVAVTQETGNIGKEVFEDPVGTAKDWMSDAAAWVTKKQEQWYEAMYDQYYPVYTMMRDMNGGAMPESVEENFYLMARMQHGSDALAKLFLEKGVRTLDGRELGPSMTDALNPVSETQRMYRDFARYAIARRAQELHEQKKRDASDDKPSRPDDFDVKIGEEEANMKIEQLFADESETFQDGEYNGLGYDQEKFEQAFEDLQEYNSALLDYAIDEGYLSPEEAEKMRRMNKAYVPWQRVMDTDENKEDYGDGGDGLQYFEGGSKDLVIDNPLKNLVANTHSLLREIHRNRIYEALFKNIPDTDQGERNSLSAAYAREVPKPQERVDLTANKIVQKLKDEGVDEDQAEDIKDRITDENGEMLSFFVPKKYMGENGADDVVRVMVDGQEKWMEVEAEFENALGNGDTAASRVAQGLNDFGPAEAMRKTATFFRGMVTSENPVFGVFNLFRDVPTRAIQSVAESVPAAIGGMFGSLKIATNLLKDDAGSYQEVYEDFLSSGAGMATLSMVQRETNQDADSVRRAAASSTAAGDAKAGIQEMFAAFEGYANAKKENGDPSLMNGFKQMMGRVSPLHIARNFNNALENANRVREFQSVQSNIMNEEATRYAEENGGADISDDPEALRKAKRKAALVAGMRARQVVIDFSRTGKWGRVANRYIPFFNAALQGWDRVKQTFRENPKRAAKMIGLTQVLPSVLVAVANAGNKYYEEEDDFTKDKFWLIPDPNGDHDQEGTPMEFYRIPKPHIYGAFGSAVERFVNYAVKEGHISEGEIMEAFTGFGDRIRRGQESGFVESVGAQIPFNAARPFTEGPVKGTGLSMIEFFGVHPLLTAGEHAVNYSVFKGREIVPQGDKDRLEPYLTYSETSSKTAREFADAAKEFGINTSPRVVDHYIDGLFGTGGRIAISAVADNALNATQGADADNLSTIQNRAKEELRSGEGDPSDLAMTYEGYSPDGQRESSFLSVPDMGFVVDPITKKFVAGDQFRGSKSVSRTYRTVNRAQKASSSLEAMITKGRPKEEIRSYIEDNLLSLQLGGAASESGGPAGDVRQELMDMQEKKKKVLSAGFENKSATEKLGMLQKIWIKQVELARKFNETVNNEMDKIHEGEIDPEAIAQDAMSNFPER